MTKTKNELPSVTDKQLEFLRAYRDLYRQLGHTPSLQELIDNLDGRYSGRSGVQYMVNVLSGMQLIKRPRWLLGEITELGQDVLHASRGRKV
jgi:hypothetical protein